MSAENNERRRPIRPLPPAETPNRLTINLFSTQRDLEVVQELARENASDAVRHSIRLYRVILESIRDGKPVTIDGKEVILL